MRLPLAGFVCALVFFTGDTSAQDRPRGDIVEVIHRPPSPIPTRGPHLAPVTIDFFLDPQDSRSIVVHRLLEILSTRHPTRLRIRYRLIGRSERHQPILEAAHEAAAQGKFFEFLEAYYGVSYLAGTGRDVDRVAEELGLDLERLQAALSDRRHEPLVRADVYFSRRYRVRSTPSMLVNGTPYSIHEAPMRSLEALEAAYDEGLERARALEERGVPLDELHPMLLRQAASERPIPRVGAGRTDGIMPERHSHGKPISKLPGKAATHDRGPASAPVVIDFYCRLLSRNCMALNKELDDIREAYPDEVRVVFHPVLPDRKLDDEGMVRRMQVALLCAADQGAYWRFYDDAFASMHARFEDLLAQVSDSGIELQRLTRCLEDKNKLALLETAASDAKKTGIVHIPSMVIGGRIIVGTHSFETIRDLIDQELAPGVLGGLLP